MRAAMTCIRFFTHGATSYIQLGEQQVPPPPSSFTRSSHTAAACLAGCLPGWLLTPDSASHLLPQRWLVRAKEHLRTYLQEQQCRSSGRKKSQVNSFRKTMSSSDVSRFGTCLLILLFTKRNVVLLHAQTHNSLFIDFFCCLCYYLLLL